MVANWGINAILGLTAFLFTYFFSLVNNTWQTSISRAGIGFLLFFILGYIFRFVLYQIALKKTLDLIQKKSREEESKQEEKRKSHVEEVTMDEPSFQAIPLRSLHNGEDAKDPEKVASTIRTWTKQNQEG
jgi:hypothetical protein